MGKSKEKVWTLENAHELAEAGLDIVQIASVLKLDVETVKEHAKRNGWQFVHIRAGQGRQVTWDVIKAKRLRELGRTWVEIGRELGVEPSLIRSFFRRNGWHNPKPRPQLNWDVKEAKRLYDGGLTNWTEIGRRVNTHGQNVRRAFIRWGWV